jgi:hypothetical protein
MLWQYYYYLVPLPLIHSFCFFHVAFLGSTSLVLPILFTPWWSLSWWIQPGQDSFTESDLMGGSQMRAFCLSWIQYLECFVEVLLYYPEPNLSFNISHDQPIHPSIHPSIHLIIQQYLETLFCARHCASKTSSAPPSWSHCLVGAWTLK